MKRHGLLEAAWLCLCICYAALCFALRFTIEYIKGGAR